MPNNNEECSEGSNNPGRNGNEVSPIERARRAATQWAIRESWAQLLGHTSDWITQGPADGWSGSDPGLLEALADIAADGSVVRLGVALIVATGSVLWSRWRHRRATGKDRT